MLDQNGVYRYVCMFACLYTMVFSCSHVSAFPPKIRPYAHIHTYTNIKILILLRPPQNCHTTSSPTTAHCILRQYKLPCAMPILFSKRNFLPAPTHTYTPYHPACHAMPSRAHTYMPLPAPRGPDRPVSTLAHNVSHILYILPAPLSAPVPAHPPSPAPLRPSSSLRTVSLPTMIHGWAWLYASLPGQRHECLRIGGICCFSRFWLAFQGPSDCGAAIRGRIGGISCQVTL